MITIYDIMVAQGAEISSPAWQLKLRLPLQGLPAQTGNQPAQAGFAAVGAVSTAGPCSQPQHEIALIYGDDFRVT